VAKWNGIDVPLHTVVSDPRLSAFGAPETPVTEPGYFAITEENLEGPLKSDAWYLPKKTGESK